MPQVTCPLCGAINDSRAPDYPFCVGCQDNLARCGYCRWFDADTAVCTHPIVAGIFDVTETATPPCVYHAPIDRIVGKRRVLRGLAWVTVGAVLAVLIFGLLRLRTTAPPPAAELGVAIEADYMGAVVGQPYTVTAVIYNKSDVPVGGIRLEITESSLDDFQLLAVTPEPAAAHKHGKWEMLSYAALGARERRRVSVKVIPRKAGTVHLVVRLVSADNVYHGMADLPVIVEPAGSQHALDGDREAEQ